MLAIIIVIVGIALDQVTKLWASGSFVGQTIEIIPGIINFTYAENTGAAFGIFANATWLLAVVSFVLAVVMGVFLIKTRKVYGAKKYGKLYVVSLSMIISGAIGNLIDRVLLGYVVDFIQFDFVSFPVFNVADSLVCVGTAMLAVYWLFLLNRVEKAEKLAMEAAEQTSTKDEVSEQDEANLTNDVTSKVNEQTQADSEKAANEN